MGLTSAHRQAFLDLQCALNANDFDQLRSHAEVYGQFFFGGAMPRIVQACVTQQNVEEARTLCMGRAMICLAFVQDPEQRSAALRWFKLSMEWLTQLRDDRKTTQLVRKYLGHLRATGTVDGTDTEIVRYLYSL